MTMRVGLLILSFLLAFTTPSHSETFVSSQLDIQSAINSANGTEIVIPCGTWSTSAGFSISSAGASIRGESPGCATIHLTANVPAFSCSGVSSPVVIHDLSITGTAPNFNGTINISDSGQEGVHILNCSNVRIENIDAENLSGTAFDCEQPASSFETPSLLRFSNLTVHDSYRAFYPRNSCEYAVFEDVIARNNIFGAQVLSGNIEFSGFHFVYNYTNIQIVGQSNNNPCHGIFNGGTSNHSFAYNLDVLSCSLGETFSGVDFIGDNGGSLQSGGGSIRIANSRGIDITGGVLGSNVVVEQADPTGWATSSFSGANKIEGALVRDDIAGFTNPSIGYTGGLELKLNVDFNGQWIQNN